MTTYTMTDDTINVVYGGQLHAIRKGAPNFHALRAALIRGDEDISEFLTTAKAVRNWAKGSFRVEGQHVFFKDEALPDVLGKRILTAASEGMDPAPFLKFWERLQNNPSMRSIEQLYPFLEHQGIPISEDGCFLAYKSVTVDFKDHHTKKVNNRVGALNAYPRNKISDDPRNPCDRGFHVGALSYAEQMWPNDPIIICKIDPADVVCVPYDESHRKIRICRYRVVGHHGAQLSSIVTAKDEETPRLSKRSRKTETKRIRTRAGQKVVKKGGKWAKFHKMDEKKLLEQHTDVLRQYANKSLSILGASKISGGKLGLIEKILRTRKHG